MSRVLKFKPKTVLLGAIFLFSTLNIVEIFNGISLLTICTGLFCLIIVLEKWSIGKITITWRDPHIFLPFMLIFITWISTLWSTMPSITIQRNYAYTILPLFYIFVMICDLNFYDLNKIDNFIIFSGVCYLVYVFATQGFWGIMSGRFATTADMDQNATASTLYLIILVLFKKIKMQFEKKKSVIFLIIILILHHFTTL